MENQSSSEPIASSQQLTQTQAKSEASSVPLVDSRPKATNFLVVLLSILLFISLSIAAFFAYRTQQLVKELTLNSNLQNDVEKELDDHSSDITSAWNTYKNEKFSFEIKYPNNYIVSNENSYKESVYFVPDNYETLPEQEKYSAVTVNLNILLENDINSFVNLAGEPGFGNKRDITDKNIAGQMTKQFMSNNIQIGSGVDEINTVIQLPNSKNLLLVTVTAQGNGDPYFLVNQILSTLKFDNSKLVIPYSVSSLFESINTNFKINLVPVAEDQFYSPSGMINKKSWKIDFVNANLGKSLTSYLLTQLTSNDSESGGIGGGGTDAYQNDNIKCFHIYGYRSGDPTNWKDPFNYLTCAEK